MVSANCDLLENQVGAYFAPTAEDALTQNQIRAALLSTPEARLLDRLRKDLAACEAYELRLK